jgi:hypothetical protein
MTTTHFNGPVKTGPRPNVDSAGPANQGYCVLTQSAVLAFNGTNAVSATITLPPNSQILQIFADTTTAWNSATSDTLTVGTAAAGTQYITSVDVKVASPARGAPTLSSAQLLAMSNISTNTSVVATITPVGSASAGSTTVTVMYVQIDR